MDNNVEKFDKHQIDIRDHLISAVERGRINKKFVPTDPIYEDESDDQYIKRISELSCTYQFVEVKIQDKKKYVAFNLDSKLVTKEGDFQVITAEVVGGKWGIHYILIYPDLKQVISSSKDIYIRTDSGCHIGMVFGDTTCDCHAQLKKAQSNCIKEKLGIIIHIPNHDGRGWGTFKLSNQRIMNELNMDTVKVAQKFYGHKDLVDVRTYDEAAVIMKALGFSDKHNFKLSTNNPKKIKAFNDANINIVDIERIVCDDISESALRNLKSKSKEWNHMICPISTKENLSYG